MLAGEPVAGAAEPGLDLVGDEQDAVLARTTRPPGPGTRAPARRTRPRPGSARRAPRRSSSSPTWACTWEANVSNASSAHALRPGRPAERVGHRHPVDLAGERAEAVLVRHVLRRQRHRQVRPAVVGVVERPRPPAARSRCRAIFTAFSTASAPELNSADRFSCVAGRQLVELLGDRDVALVRRHHEAGVREIGDLLPAPPPPPAARRCRPTSPRCPSRSRSAGCRRRRPASPPPARSTYTGKSCPPRPPPPRSCARATPANAARGPRSSTAAAGAPRQRRPPYWPARSSCAADVDHGDDVALLDESPWLTTSSRTTPATSASTGISIFIDSRKTIVSAGPTASPTARRPGPRWRRVRRR